MGRPGLGVVLAIALLALTAVPAAAAPQPIDIYAKPWDAGAVVDVTIPPDRTGASVPVQIFLGQRLPPRQDPRFGLSVLAPREPADAQVPVNPRIRMLVGGRDVTGGGLHPPTRGTWAAELRVEGIDTFGTFEGDILAGIGRNPLSSRVHLVIRRYPAAELTFGGGGDALTATTSEETVDLPVEIRNTTIGEARSVHLGIGPIRSTEGTAATVELLGGALPTTFAGRQAVSRTLRVRLPAPGRYGGTLTLFWDGSTQELPIRIERLVPPPGVTILAAQGVVAGEIPWCGPLPGDPDRHCPTDALWLAVQETQGREVTVDAPTLRSLARQADGRRIAMPDVTMTTTLECVGDPASDGEATAHTAGLGSVPLAIAAPAVQTCGRATYDALARRLTLGPHAVARLRLDVAGALTPGEYVAEVALASPSATAIGAEAALALRLPAIAALAAFLAGCIVALPLRRPLTLARRQIRRRTRSAIIGARLGGASRIAPDAEARAIVARTHATVDRVLDGIRARAIRGRQVDRWLDDLETRVDGLDRWLAIWADSERTSGALQDRIRSRLMTVARTFTQDEPLSDLDRRMLAEIDALRDQLAVGNARQSPVRDPQLRRTDEPTLTDEWRWMLRSARRRVHWSILLETVTLIVLTVVAGLTFVWAPDATWGSPTDVAVAVLWSVVVVVVASAALTGLAAIRGQLARPDWS